jgi:hypothetical protein
MTNVLSIPQIEERKCPSLLTRWACLAKTCIEHSSELLILKLVNSDDVI